MATDLQALAAEFPPTVVSWRAQTLTGDGTKALALAYIDARDVMDRLDEVCGPANWQDRYEFHGPRTVCYLSLRIGDEWVTKADGAGDSDVEAEKGAISDALKRAAVKWGIGRYLYAIESPWVPCETYERGGKKHWKKWAADPWTCVRRPAAPTAEPPLKRQLAESLCDELSKKLDAATNAEELKVIWRENIDAINTLPANWKKTLTDFAGTVKSRFAAPATLGAHLDNLERMGAGN